MQTENLKVWYFKHGFQVYENAVLVYAIMLVCA